MKHKTYKYYRIYVFLDPDPELFQPAGDRPDRTSLNFEPAGPDRLQLCNAISWKQNRFIFNLRTCISRRFYWYMEPSLIGSSLKWILNVQGDWKVTPYFQFFITLKQQKIFSWFFHHFKTWTIAFCFVLDEINWLIVWLSQMKHEFRQENVWKYLIILSSLLLLYEKRYHSKFFNALKCT